MIKKYKIKIKRNLTLKYIRQLALAHSSIFVSSLSQNTWIINDCYEIDEEFIETYHTLETNGKYFRATDLKKPESVYDEIDEIRKSVIER